MGAAERQALLAAKGDALGAFASGGRLLGRTEIQNTDITIPSNSSVAIMALALVLPDAPVRVRMGGYTYNISGAAVAIFDLYDLTAAKRIAQGGASIGAGGGFNPFPQLERGYYRPGAGERVFQARISTTAGNLVTYSDAADPDEPTMWMSVEEIT